jgi:hypothetical protein
MNERIGEMNERILEDDYPVYPTFWYLADGVPKRSPLQGTVRDLRREFKCAEVRRCAAVARGLMRGGE